MSAVLEFARIAKGASNREDDPSKLRELLADCLQRLEESKGRELEALKDREEACRELSAAMYRPGGALAGWRSDLRPGWWVKKSYQAVISVTGAFDQFDESRIIWFWKVEGAEYPNEPWKELSNGVERSPRIAMRQAEGSLRALRHPLQNHWT